MKIGRAAREGTAAALNILLFLGIAALLQYLSFRHPHEWDLTKNKRYSLSPLSAKVLARLKNPLEIWAFTAPADRQTRDLIHSYQTSGAAVDAHFIDPVSRPAKAREFGVSAAPVLILRYGNAKEQVLQINEETVTNAVNRLISGEARVVYFLQGSGEGDLNAADGAGYSSWRDALQDENVTVKPLALFQNKIIPDDAASIVIAGPRDPLQTAERKILDAYLRRGGGALFLCAMDTPPSWTAFLKRFGVTAENNLVTDPRNSVIGGGPEFLIANSYFSHAVTEPFLGKKNPDPLFLPLTRGLSPADPLPKTEEVEPLVETSVYGQAVPVKAQGKRLMVNMKAAGKRQNIPVAEVMTLRRENAKAAAPETKPGQMIVVGCALFAQNKWIANYANRDFLLNAVSWLSGNGNTISIRPKTPENTPFLMDSKSLSAVFLMSLIGLPGFGILLGVGSWLRRRAL